MNKILFLMITIFTLFSASSCRFKDIDRRAFIVAMGLDLSESGDEFDISVKVAVPKTQQAEGGGGPDKKNFIFYRTSDRSIGTGLRKIKAQMSLDPDFSHLKAIVLSRDITNHFSLDEIIYYFVRRGDIQQIAWLLVGEPSARDVIELMPEGENFAGNYLFMKFGQGVQPQFVNITETNEAFANMNVPGVSISCPIIKVRSEHYVAESTAIFHEGKLAMTLDMDQTRILNILEMGLNVGFITTYDEDKKPIGVRIQKGKAKISLKEDSKESMTCSIDMKVTGLLEEYPDTSYDNSAIESKLENLFASQTLKLMNDLQSRGLDPLALQVKYWAKHPEYSFSKDWVTQVYPRIKFNVTSDVKILQPETIK